MKRLFAASIIALIVGVVSPAGSSGLGLSNPDEGDAQSAVESIAPQPAAESPEDTPSLASLAKEVKELRASRNRSTIAVIVAGVTAMAAGVGLFLVADDELEDLGNANNRDLKFARGSGVVCFGLGLFGLIAGAGP